MASMSPPGSPLGPPSPSLVPASVRGSPDLPMARLRRRSMKVRLGRRRMGWCWPAAGLRNPRHPWVVPAKSPRRRPRAPRRGSPDPSAGRRGTQVVECRNAPDRGSRASSARSAWLKRFADPVRHAQPPRQGMSRSLRGPPPGTSAVASREQAVRAARRPCTGDRGRGSRCATPRRPWPGRDRSGEALRFAGTRRTGERRRRYLVTGMTSAGPRLLSWPEG